MTTSALLTDVALVVFALVCAAGAVAAALSVVRRERELRRLKRAVREAGEL